MVFGELTAGRWFAGSDFFRRSNNNTSNPYTTETVAQQLLHMVNTYDDLDNVVGGAIVITAYRNGVAMGSQVTSQNSVQYGAGAEVLFGPRVTQNGAPFGVLDAAISYARIDNTALSASAVAAGFQAGVPPVRTVPPVSTVPLPASALLLIGGLGGLGFLSARRRKA